MRKRRRTFTNPKAWVDWLAVQTYNKLRLANGIYNEHLKQPIALNCYFH